MATIDDGELLVEIEDADEEGLRRALVAAREAIDATGVSLDEAFLGHFEVEQASFRGEAADPRFVRGAEALQSMAEAAGRACFPDRLDVHVDLAKYDVWVESERQIDEAGVRHLNPDAGPHYSLRH